MIFRILPRLVMGYSVKSRGIGLDLGMERWVIPVEDSEKLPERAVELWECRRQIQAHLLRALYQSSIKMRQAAF